MRHRRIAALLVAAGMVLVPQQAFAADAPQTVVVQPGDTLWVIASEVAAPGDVREMVHRIQELNAMAGPGLAVGQKVAVPVG